MKKVYILLVISAFLTACNTVDGLGKDLEKAGEAVQKSSK
jgi:predicted small secreted protein